MEQYPKRLIEVDLPIKRISAHARREKSIRHGHISTLHIWWARRPLAACRAVICASLWPDPVDALCPQPFREAATEVINAFAQKAMTDKSIDEKASSLSMGRWAALTKQPLDASNPEHWNVLRFALLDFIADFANWDNSTHPVYLETSRTLTQTAHEALGGLPGTRPLVVDPFAGGGAIPLEALRVGADAFATDINPVAVLLNKVVLEYIPRYGQNLADEVSKWGKWIQEEAEKDLAEYYPNDPDGSIPIAYIWARTIVCEGPSCGVEIPLLSSLWLSRDKKSPVGLRLIPDKTKNFIHIDIVRKIDNKWESDTFSLKGFVPSFNGTIKKSSATCPKCGYTTPANSIRKQMHISRGSVEKARLVALVLIPENGKGRSFRLSTPSDLEKIHAAQNRLSYLKESNSHEQISLIPNEPVNPLPHSINRLPMYGMGNWGDIYNPRQALSLATFVSLVRQVGEKLKSDDDSQFAKAIQTCLALNVDRVADRSTTFCRYDPSPKMSGINNTFARQAISMIWDFGEGNPIIDRSGGWIQSISWLLLALEREAQAKMSSGTTAVNSATESPLPNDSVQAFITDPPYYDMISYADLSDFFYVWLKRSLANIDNPIGESLLTPKEEEIIVEPSHVQNVGIKDEQFYLDKMTDAMREGFRILHPSGIGMIVFAHKSTAGWESLLQSLIEASWTVTGSWPIDTEMSNKVAGIGQARLMSSIHLVCRPRTSDSVGDWRDVLQELPKRIHAWLPRLAQEGVVGADAIFACLGPALEIFSRYARVEKASGEIITLGEYLEYVWGAVSREALNMVFAGADTTDFEEDARLTAMWLWTLSADEDETESSKVVASTGYTLEYDAARKISQGLGAHLEQLTHLVEVSGSNARLLPVAERTRYLFGKDGLKTGSQKSKPEPGAKQLSLLDQLPDEAAAEWRLSEEAIIQNGKTMLDRVHQAMLLFAAGRSDALKSFLVTAGVGQDEGFWRLANALSALYPAITDEKRWVDGVLARKKGLGF